MSRNVKKDQSLKESQLLAAQLLAAGKTGREAAEAAGVTEETISRWRKNCDFDVYLKELMVDLHETARMRLQSLVQKAVLAIEASIDDPSLTAKEKFTIAVKIFEMCNGYNCALTDQVKRQNDPFNLNFFQ